MAITFRIPSYLAGFADGKTCLTLEHAATTGDALSALWQRYPGLQDRIVDEQGEVRQHINIFVGNECTRFTGGLATPVPDGTEILIVPAVSGGNSAKDVDVQTWHATSHCTRVDE